MKEATGELNMTVVAVVAIAAIAAVFAFLLPTIKNKLSNSINNADSTAKEVYDKGEE